MIEMAQGGGNGYLPNQKRVPKSRKVDHARDINGIHAPGEVQPSVNLTQTAHVATESRSRLAKELSIELAGVAERGEHGTVVHVLNGNLPAVTKHPASAVVVVVGVQGTEQTKEEHLAVVAAAEIGILVDLGANGCGATGDDKDAAVYVGLRADLEVVTLKVEAADKIGEAGPQAAGGVAQNFLVGADHADLGVVEGGDEGV